MSYQPELRPFLRRGDTTLRCALTPHEGTTGSTLALEDPVLRLRVLDARSRAPVVNAVVRHAWLLPSGVPDPKASERAAYDAQYGALRVPRPVDWDVRENPPLVVDAHGHGFSKPDWSKLKQALVALGYEAGRGKHEDRALASALTQFRADHGLPEPKPKEKDARVVPHVIAEHNKRAFRMVQRYLTAFGFDCIDDDGGWQDASKKAFATWEKIHFPHRKLHALPTAEDGRELTRENTHFKTDSGGVARLSVPVALMRKGFRLVLEFDDFGCIAACDIDGWNREGTPVVEWAGEQDLIADKLGWRLRGPGDERSTHALPEFRGSLTFRLPPLPGLRWEMDDLAAGLAAFRPDFRDPSAPAEIDLIALVWCQPAWDAVEDPRSHRTNANVYLPTVPRTVQQRRLHVVTRYTAGGSRGYPDAAEGYGLLDVLPNGTWAQYRGRAEPHYGIDVQVVVGDPVFAVHGGEVKPKSQGASVGAGHYVILRDANDPRIHLSYFHLQDAGRSHGHVRAGEIVGRLGRTGNINHLARTPSHVHIERRGDEGETFGLAAIAGATNGVCFPTNTTIPRLFPCRCEMNPEAPEEADINDCRCQNETFTNDCWAVGKLVCPHLRSPGVDAFRHQAQLRWIHRGAPEQYPDPGPIDGRPSKRLAAAVLALRQLNGLPAQGGLDTSAVAVLDALAPTLAPEAM